MRIYPLVLTVFGLLFSCSVFEQSTVSTDKKTISSSGESAELDTLTSYEYSSTPITRVSNTSISLKDELMVEEINLLRKNPQDYIQWIKEYLREVKYSSTYSAADKHNIRNAAQELMYELSRTAGLKQLAIHEGLYRVALEEEQMITEKGLDHFLSQEGQRPWELVQYYTDLNDGNHNILYAKNSIRETVVEALVDAGIAGRPHRYQMLNPKWEFVSARQVIDSLSGQTLWIQLFGGDQITKPLSNPVASVDGIGDNGDVESSVNAQPIEYPRDYSNEETKLLDLEEVPFMVAEEKAMLKEINVMRKDPKAYISSIHEYLKNFEAAGWDASTIEEERKAADELIIELSALDRIPQLKPLKSLQEVARNHGKYLKKTGRVDHTGEGGTTPFDRIKTTNQLSDGSENLVGGGTSVKESVIMLLIDAGIPSRGHRKNLLNPNWVYGACYLVGEVAGVPEVYVQNFGR